MARPCRFTASASSSLGEARVKLGKKGKLRYERETTVGSWHESGKVKHNSGTGVGSYVAPAWELEPRPSRRQRRAVRNYPVGDGSDVVVVVVAAAPAQWRILHERGTRSLQEPMQQPDSAAEEGGENEDVAAAVAVGWGCGPGGREHGRTKRRRRKRSPLSISRQAALSSLSAADSASCSTFSTCELYIV